MDHVQVGLKLACDYLEIPVSMENYRLICNVCYFAEKKGFRLTTEQVLWHKQEKGAYSPMSQESGGNPSRNLEDDVAEIEREASSDHNLSDDYVLGEKHKSILDQVRAKLIKRKELPIKHLDMVEGC